jgi:hypothetical protein
MSPNDVSPHKDGERERPELNDQRSRPLKVAMLALEEINTIEPFRPASNHHPASSLGTEEATCQVCLHHGSELISWEAFGGGVEGDAVVDDHSVNTTKRRLSPLHDHAAILLTPCIEVHR